MIYPLTYTEGVERMNQLGRARVPFLFVWDYALRVPVVLPLEMIDASELCYQFNNRTNATAVQTFAEILPIFKKKPLTLEAYRQKFEKVVAHIKRGDSFLVNLSVCTPITTNLDLQDIFLTSQAKYKLWWRNHFVCFSPEVFVQVRGNRIASFPMKGTIDAAVPDAAARILADVKEAAEHATIVDLIRNDLSMVATKVWVERYRYLDRLPTNQKTLLQVSSEVAGLLPDTWRDYLGDWFVKLLPAGSICGAPKPRTLEIIQEAEGYERGYYTGVAGIFDGENLDSGVLIRFVEQVDNQLFFKSGGGITARSEATAEYQEVIDKIYLPICNSSLMVIR
jgi:para-aminobenzoate synthetase component 1